MSDRCDPEVYDKGTIVFFTNTVSSKDMEDWVLAIARDSGQKVDWFWAGGRAVVQALGDLHKVRKAIIKTRDMHDKGYTKAVKELKCFRDEEIEEDIRDIWDYNYRTYDLWSYVCSKCRGRCMPQNHAGWDPTQEGHG